MKLNPYQILRPDLLDALLRQPLYFVRQLYPRGLPPGNDNLQSLLLTHYNRDATGKERADRHMRMLHRDPCRFLYDSTIQQHRDRLSLAATQPAGYLVYINLLPHAWKPDRRIKQQLQSYLLNQHPFHGYQPRDGLQVNLQERYGQLYVALLWKGRQMEVHLDELEQYGLCATT